MMDLQAENRLAIISVGTSWLENVYGNDITNGLCDGIVGWSGYWSKDYLVGGAWGEGKINVGIKD